MESGDDAFLQLEQAHDRLTAAYTKAHRDANKQRLVAPPVDDYLRDGADYLRDEYILARETTFASAKAGQWFDREIVRLESLASTFDRHWLPSGSPAMAQSVIGFPGITTILVASGGAVGVVAVTGLCFCYLLKVIPLIVMVGLLIVGAFGFDEADKLLANEDVLASEVAVYGLLGVEGPSRRRHWPILFTVIAVMWWLVVWLEHRAISEHRFISHRGFVFWVFAAFFTVVAFGAFLWRGSGKDAAGSEQTGAER
jgi:hypothetical protein